MDCGYLNELSSFSGSEVRTAMLRLLDTIDATCFRVRVPVGALDRPVFGRSSLRTLVFSEFHTPVDVDKQRRLVVALLDSQPIESDELPWRYGDREAAGLTAAMRAEALAISFTQPIWNESIVTIAHRDGSPTANVLHASTRAHAAVHRVWLDRTASPLDMLRRQLVVSRVVHMPASAYTSGKHVKTKTNGGRRAKAEAIGGAGQFLAERDGRPFGDAEIQAVEALVLDEVRRGTLYRDAVVEGSGVTFKVYARLDAVIGYHGGSGYETNWIRVEFSSGEVHSHPHTPDGHA